MKFTSKIPSNISPKTTLAQYLAQRFTYHSIGEWNELITNGQVLLNNSKVSASSLISAGMIIEYDPGDFEEPDADLNYKIIFEDDWFIGISKPGNLLVHRAGRSFRNNLIYQLRFVHQPAYKNAHTTHRLDRDTSGVVLIAKTSEARAAIGLQFAAGEVKKEYIAIVHGIPDSSIERISFPIGKTINSAISYKYCVDPSGKEAITIVKSVHRLGESFAELLLQPLTGRTHQIRIHCAAIGHPIVGDKLYGLSEEAYLTWRDNPQSVSTGLLFHRHALHCRSLTFFHPYLKRECTVVADLPEDMSVLAVSLTTR
ncbi:MAG: RluA family pseudouridine synthase [Fibrobacter sp.]|nr:RluA family pseudouridine synthase [Fibrobacter sp.]